jgi:hypothetical protein
MGWTELHSAAQKGDLYEPFYGGREFGIRDAHGYELFFLQER